LIPRPIGPMTMTHLNDPMIFDDPRAAVPVSIEGVDYTLREATAAQAAKFVNARASMFRVSADGQVVGLKSIGDLPSLLVSMCLYTADDKPVRRDVVDRLGQPILDKLFQRALDISGLRERDERLVTKLKAALAQPDAPTTWDDLTRWAATLDAEEYPTIRKLFEVDAETAGKN